ncbi:hypothetical protein SAMN05518670_5147 [Paenibacillus sp. OK076]|nr:hypothetical protein SAMN05518670_5147 [Paenibacillus sp. OK076]
MMMDKGQKLILWITLPFVYVWKDGYGLLTTVTFFSVK